MSIIIIRRPGWFAASRLVRGVPAGGGVPENKLWASRSLPPAAGAFFWQFLAVFRF